MIQLNMFDVVAAREARDKGIQQAIQHAEEVHSGWGDQVFALLKRYLELNPHEFLAEDFRLLITGQVPDPPSMRAYGAVFAKAVRAGLIHRVRYEPVKNVRAHRANASVWKRN